MSNSGYKAYANLEEYYLDNGVATGLIKSNDVGDPDYIAPVLDYTFCPLPTLSPSRTPAVSRTPSQTPSVTPSISISRTPFATPSVTPSITISRSIVVSPSTTPSVTKTPSVTPSTSSPSKYTVTIFASNETGIPTNGTKAQYSLNGSSGWTDFGPFSGYTGVCTFKGAAEFNPGDDVYIRIIGTSNQWYRHGVSSIATCPLGTSGTCVEFISSINSDAIRSFFVSNLSNCP